MWKKALGVLKVPAGSDALVHDETNRPLAQLLASLEPPFPAAMGVLYCNPATPYEREVVVERSGSLDALLNSERTWEVGGEGEIP